jgi:hypothetical protein
MIVTITEQFHMNLATKSYQFIRMMPTNTATRPITLIVQCLLAVSVCSTLPINVRHKTLKRFPAFFSVFMDTVRFFILLERMPTPDIPI